MYQKVSYYGLFSALALLMAYVEMMIPMPLVVPGVKLGLANAMILLVLYSMGSKAAVTISLVRILLSGLLFAGFAGFLYSLAGASCSLLIMVLCQKIKGFSIVGISVLGGIFHNIGQIFVASLVVQNIRLAYYLPILLVAGVATGFVVGVVTKMTLPYLKVIERS